MGYECEQQPQKMGVGNGYRRIAAVILSDASNARDRGINQPGAAGGVAGIGAPGVGVEIPA